MSFTRYFIHSDQSFYTVELTPFLLIQASLFAEMGFDALFFGRLDYDDKNKRLRDKTMEMVWQASSSLGKSSWLFTGALYNGYGPPNGFCFDEMCGDDPIMDDPR